MRNFRIGKPYPVCQICWKPIRIDKYTNLGVGPVCLKKALFQDKIKISEDERESLLKYVPQLVDKLDKEDKNE